MGGCLCVRAGWYMRTPYFLLNVKCLPPPQINVYLKKKRVWAFALKFFLIPEIGRVAKPNQTLGNSLVSLIKCSVLSDPYWYSVLHSLLSLAVSSLLITSVNLYLTQNYFVSSGIFYSKVSKKSLFECPLGTSISIYPKRKSLSPHLNSPYGSPTFM